MGNKIFGKKTDPKSNTSELKKEPNVEITEPKPQPVLEFKTDTQTPVVIQTLDDKPFTEGLKVIYPEEPLTKSDKCFYTLYKVGFTNLVHFSDIKGNSNPYRQITDKLIGILDTPILSKEQDHYLYVHKPYFIKDIENQTIILNTSIIESKLNRLPFKMPEIDIEASSVTAIQWLWNSKLKSRDSFLLIMSFINTDLPYFEINDKNENCQWSVRSSATCGSQICESSYGGLFLCQCKVVDPNLTVLRELTTQIAPGGQCFFRKFVMDKQPFMAHVDNERILYRTAETLKKFESEKHQLGANKMLTFSVYPLYNAYTYLKDQFIFRGELDERAIHPDAVYQKWFQDSMDNWCQGYALDNKLNGKGLKINFKQGWMVLGYFVGGVPRGKFTRIDNQKEIYFNER